MALSRTLHSSQATEPTIATAVQIVTSSFTPPNNSLLVVVASWENDGTPGVSSVSGGGLTWTKILSTSPHFFGGSAPDYYLYVEIWIAPVSTGASMTVTAANGDPSSGSGNGDGARLRMDVFSYTGYDTSTPTGVTASNTTAGDGALNMTLSGAPAASSEVLAIRQRTDNVTTSTTATPGAGWTEQTDLGSISPGYNDLQTQTRTGSTSTAVDWSDTSDNASASSWHRNCLAIEIKAAASGPSRKMHLNWV